MFTDMVGFTALTQSDEAQSLAVLERHNKLLRPIFPRFRGREVKTIGDSFLVEFDSALDATNCAVEVQRFLHDYNISSRDEWKITLRTGVHLGDVVRSGGDILGDAVNIASRLQPLADPEGVCISEQVYDQVRNKLPQPLVKLEPRDLKGIGFPVDVYKVVMPWEHAAAGSRSEQDRDRVAVLPFANMSPDPDDEYFADGMTEELIDRLAQVKGLEVIARTSVMSFKGEKKKASDIAKELEAGSVVEGSVRKAGNRIRVTAQLVNGVTQGHIWSSHYDGTLDDIFAVQSEIAEKVAGELSIQLLEPEKEKLEARPTGSTEAYTLYLKARQLYYGSSIESVRESIGLLEKAVSKDLSFVLAYALLARAYRNSAILGDYTDSVNKAEAAAEKALELGPEYAEAHVAMAEAHMAIDRLDEARRELEKAVEINPNLSEAYVSLAENHLTFGRFDEALYCLRKACELDPLSRDARVRMALTLRVAGRPDDALQEYRRLLELGMDPASTHADASVCYMQKGDLAGARDELSEAKQINPTRESVKARWGMFYAKSGMRHEAESVLEDLARTGREAVVSVSELYIRTFLGDIDQAFVALMKLGELHAWPASVKYEPLLQPLRDDHRFTEFCTRVGLLP